MADTIEQTTPVVEDTKAEEVPVVAEETPKADETPEVDETPKVDETTEAKAETNGHTNGDAEQKEETNGSLTTEAILPEPKTEAEAKENGAEDESDVAKEAPKRKADEGGDAPLEPIPVSAEKVAKLQEATEDKVDETAEATA